MRRRRRGAYREGKPAGWQREIILLPAPTDAHLGPMGWKEVDPVGHPKDVGTPPEQWKKSSKPMHPRKEIKRWVRGARYVRVCELFVEGKSDGFTVHIGTSGNSGDEQMFQGSWEIALVRAKTYMRMGGY